MFRDAKFHDDRLIRSRVILGKPEGGGCITPLCRRGLSSNMQVLRHRNAGIQRLSSLSYAVWGPAKKNRLGGGNPPTRRGRGLIPPKVLNL